MIGYYVLPTAITLIKNAGRTLSENKLTPSYVSGLHQPLEHDQSGRLSGIGQNKHFMNNIWEISSSQNIQILIKSLTLEIENNKAEYFNTEKRKVRFRVIR